MPRLPASREQASLRWLFAAHESATERAEPRMIAPVQLAFAPLASPQEPEPGTPESAVLRSLRYVASAAYLRGSRPALALYAGLSDRAVRRAIASLVAAGWPIVSTSDTGGYRLATKPGELDHPIAELASREQALRERRQALLRAQAGMRAG